MKLMLDLNVLLDVIQRREPFYAASATVLTQVVENEHSGCIPGHAMTTLHYIVRRYAGQQSANELVDWLLARFDVIPQDKAQFARARTLPIQDFEDAAVIAAAEAAQCDLILTRDVADFEGSPVPAMTPEEFLAQT